MADTLKPHVDAVTGIETTGHSWDDIRELNNPLPRWWLWGLYATILWSVGYWMVYPAWPLASDYTRGLFGYSQRAAVMEEVEAAKLARGQTGAALATASLEEIQANPELMKLAMANGKAAFGDNCASCHGFSGRGDGPAGRLLRPRPADFRLHMDEGHTDAQLYAWVAGGVDGTAMPAFGDTLSEEEIWHVVNYIRTFGLGEGVVR